MKGRVIPYSVEEIAWLEVNRTMVISEYHRAFCAAFGREDVSAGHLHALRKRKGWKTGRTGCFEKGESPHNKGKAFPVAATHPNCRKTQFRAGSRTGKAAVNYKPIGFERISKEGYRERKIHDGLPFKSRWKLVHRIEWESAHGPVPNGMVLKCLGDKLDTRPSNWELVPRAMLPRLNGGRHKTRIAFDDAPSELRPTIMAVAKLEHQVRERKGASA